MWFFVRAILAFLLDLLIFRTAVLPNEEGWARASGLETPVGSLVEARTKEYNMNLEVLGRISIQCTYSGRASAGLGRSIKTCVYIGQSSRGTILRLF
jgi:hypothetical protein